MELLSEDGKCTIKAWCSTEFEWLDEELNRGQLAQVDGDEIVVWTMCALTLPPEAVRWLCGERTPPEPPIAVGDKAKWGVNEGVVIAVSGKDAWFDCGNGPFTVTLSQLRRAI